MTVLMELLNGEDLVDEHFITEMVSILGQMLVEHDLESGEVTVVIADDKLLHRLNRKYRDQDRVTDVLSFSYLEPGEDIPADGSDYAVGDIYISLQRASAQAVQAGHGIRQELALLAIHGMLHLLGFDHCEEAETNRMREKEAFFLNKLNFKSAEGETNA
jgi:probable rRNA maturation factor